MAVVYIIQNQINNKIYIGVTVNLQERWYQHTSIAAHPEWKKDNRYHYLHSAIHKYGKENFSKSILETFSNYGEALDAESFWIEFFRSWDRSIGYNLTRGGEGTIGRKLSIAHKNKISKSLLGNKRSLGFKHSIETKDKMSQSHIGDKNHKAKLTEQDVRDIRNHHSENVNIVNDIFQSLSKRYGLSVSGLEKIIYRKTWKHVV